MNEDSVVSSEKLASSGVENGTAGSLSDGSS